MRTFLTILVIAAGLAVGVIFFVTNRPAPPPVPQDTSATTPDAPKTPPPAGPEHPQTQPAAPATAPSTRPAEDPHSLSPSAQTQPAQPTSPPQELHVQRVEEPSESTIGSLDPASGYEIQATLTAWGAAINRIQLTHYNQTALGQDPYKIQEPIQITLRHFTSHGETLTPIRIYPFAARALVVQDQRIDLERHPWQLDPDHPGVYRLTIVDALDQPLLQLSRRYSISKDAAVFDIHCQQTIENLSAAPIAVQWLQYGPFEVPLDTGGNMGDRRMLVAGYHNLEYDPSAKFIYTDHTFQPRANLLSRTPPNDFTPTASLDNLAPIWPNNNLATNKSDLVWFASANRYFAAALHAAGPSLTAKMLANPGNSNSPIVMPSLDQDFPTLGAMILQPADFDSKADNRHIAFTLASRPIQIPPRGSAQLDLSLFAGPRKNEVFEAQPYQSLSFSKLIRYDLGGPCSFCTFQWLAHWLLGFLKLLHVITFDWGVAIIILVLLVRAALHPITRRSQINMMKMGKQMQALQPEIEKLKKKYKNDQKRFQQEQLKLWREKGVSPFGMLGCLPMLLQTPIWIALYAMLYFAIELRHQPAFYGLFQAVSAGNWAFLADLSQPDHFFQFPGGGFNLPLIVTQLHVSGINLLPLLMAVVFYFQQKLTTPPPANEQAAQQQKIMRIMTLVLFPLMLYSSPSGLTLYILASTFAGIVDSKIIRQHIKKEEESGKLLERKAPKPGGLMGRLSKILETAQAQALNQQTSNKPRPKR